MILSRRWRRHRRLAAPLAVLAGTFVMGGATIGLAVAGNGSAPTLLPATMTAPTTSAAFRGEPRASDIGVALTVTGIPAIGQPAFSGRLGTATSGDATDRRASDYSHDPDSVKSLVKVANPSGGASGDTVSGAWDATSDPNALALALHRGGPELLRIPNLHTYVRCQPPHAPQVQNHVTAPTFADVPITDGENSIRTTGERLGYDRVSHAVLGVAMTRVRRTTPNTAAESRVEIAVDGTLFDRDTQIYSGPIARLVLGDVRAHCPGDTAALPPAHTPSPGVLKIRKTADKRHVRVGGTVRYTFIAQNTGESPMDAHFTDDLTKLLRHGTYNHDATATRGKTAYTKSHLTWTGRLTPGQKAQITFTATAHTPGKMHNVTVTRNPRRLSRHHVRHPR